MAGLIALIDLIPARVYALLCAALAAGWIISGINASRLELKVAELRTELAEAENQAAQERAARIAKVLEHERDIAERERRHTAQLQDIEHDHAKQTAAAQARAAADAVALDRLRKQVAAFTARGGSITDPGPAPAERYADRLETLGSLYAESLDLLVEGRGIIERRDLEVKRLVDQLHADRALCGARVTTASVP